MLLVLGMPAMAYAQAFPTKVITIVVPFAAGGPTDTVTRLLAQSMSKTLGQQVIVENVGGAGGTIGAVRVAKASPDGYTLLLHHIGMATTMTLYRKPSPGGLGPAPDRNGESGAAPAASLAPTPPPSRPGGGATPPTAPAVPATREAATETPYRGAATARQLQAIWRIARGEGLDSGAVEGMSLRAFNRKPDALTTGEASALIRELSTMRRVAA